MLPVTYYPIIIEKNGGWTVNLTSDPALVWWWVVKNEYDRVWSWDRPFPLWLAEQIRAKLALYAETGKAGFSLRRLGRMLAKTARRYGWNGEGSWVPVTDGGRDRIRFPAASGEENITLLGAILPKVLLGRALTPQEIRSALARNGVRVTPYLLTIVLQELVLVGKVELTAAVGLDRWGRFYCRRCGEWERIFPEKLAGSAQPTRICSGCRELGAVTDQTPLYHWRDPQPKCAPPASPPVLVLPTLTRWQERAVTEIMAFWRQPEKRTMLVWAVCGAGKTEVVFPVIQAALAEGKRVLLTVPRREIVQELSGRIKKCFPGLPFSLLYGGHKEEVPDALLVVATTHQLLRFTAYFDLVIVDEADAFPLYNNPVLNAALDRVVLPTGKQVYLTATPDRSWRRRAAQGAIAVTKLPLRHHGQPLPVPHLVRTAIPSRDDQPLPALVRDFILTRRTQGRKGLIFLPTVEAVETFAIRLKKAFPHEAPYISHIHARDPFRRAKVEQFSSGILWLLVTTTLLERGLNFDRLDLMILHADQEAIFSEETLIQIAGRVGRKAEDPGGAVYFVAPKITPTMKAARNAILRMNREGAKARPNLKD
ncbi:MAG TPA: DEAD/DEAH box helicase family protein [Firmicutes bacterium]|uniref:DEAD/DEAH box helicase family protein n=1 Tax=Capillibacterium thermochitinicola TaxID=2699427 RepID=A0A8J6HYS6_9FIRM|nr:DEAD/DEAH box helicase [Capillibacterium thermochitinicola]MBA2132326.1 DEAD/DEAH box helicase family protein [Capillibacterium thermochitinicola]HHW12614.1 DEAD/DEAH box helicase family protein [Bacillota bacterium]